jgi:hypothetical protein
MSDYPNLYITQEDMDWIDENTHEIVEKPRTFESLMEDKGKPCERAVLAHIRTFYPDAYMVEGYDPEKDIVSPAAKKTWEVKNSEDAIVCVPIEVATRHNDSEQWKPSGISTSTATYWVLYCHKEYIMILTELLRDIIKEIEITISTPLTVQVQNKPVLISILEANATHIWEDTEAH